MKPKKPDYRPKEEIIFDNKRYRLYNNYVTLGGGVSLSTIRNNSQRTAGIDYHFHIRRTYFQLGVLLSGNEFFSNNHLQAHFCYGIRKEDGKNHFAAFGGFSYYQGVEGVAPQPAVYYGGSGFYFAGQYVRKITYDVGGGIEAFADIGYSTPFWGRDQALYGVKLIVFFSGAYRGPKRNYNPHVRAENPNG